MNNPDPIYAGPVVGAESGWPFWLTVDEGLKINTRAWTLQEKVLSSRMVHFRGDQISWECKHGQEYERGDPYGTRYWGPHESLQVEKSYKSWHDLVEDYSSRTLTFSTDKLSALAGLAKAFWLKTEERDQYMGGVWRGSLPNSLLWNVSSSILAERVPDPDQPLPCAPTWSWASVNTKVVFDGEDNVDIIEVLECQTLSEDPFSPTVKGKLVVCGSVKEAKIILSPDRGDLHYYELFDENFFDTGRNERIGAALNDHSAPENEIAEARRAEPQHGWPKSLEVHCLRVRKGQGLLLRLSGHEDDEYVRVGYFYLFHHSLLPDSITDDQWQDSWFNCPAMKITIFNACMDSKLHKIGLRARFVVEDHR